MWYFVMAAWADFWDMGFMSRNCPRARQGCFSYYAHDADEETNVQRCLRSHSQSAMELGLELWWSGCRALSLTPAVPPPRGPWGLAHSGDSTVLELQSEMAKQTQSRDLSDVYRVGGQSAAHPHLFSSPLQLPTDHKNTFLSLFQMWPQNCSQRKTLSSQYTLTGAGSESLAPTLFVERLRGTRHCHWAARTQPFTTKTRGPCPQGKRWGKDQQNL